MNLICQKKAALAPEEKKGLTKNNSFDEKTNGIKSAMSASLAATEDPESPWLRRGRGMTEGTDEYQINVLNANTHGMIK